MLDYEFYYFVDEKTAEKRLSGFAAAHVVYDLPYEEVISTYTDVASYPSFVPRIIETHILESSKNSYKIRHKAGISILGIKMYYTTDSQCFVEEPKSNALGIRAYLLDSPDQRSYEYFTSTYFEEVTVNGKKMTYIRYFNRPGLRNPISGTKSIMSLFITSETSSQLSAIYKETKRRIKAKTRSN